MSLSPTRRSLVLGVLAVIVMLAPSAAAGWIVPRPTPVQSSNKPPVNFGREWRAAEPNGIRTWFVEPKLPNAPVIVMVHGYTQPRSDLRRLAQHLNERGYGIVLPELPYIDGSQPYSGGDDEADAVCSVVKWASSEFDRKVVVSGYSAGGFASSLAVTDGCPISVLITDSAFVDAATTFRRASSQRTRLPTFAFFALRPAFALSTGDGELRNIREQSRPWLTPTFIIHGAADNYVPPNNARQLQQITRGEIWIVRGADHGGAWYKNATAYEERVDIFIRNALKAPGW